jgi:hypothetical protein
LTSFQQHCCWKIDASVGSHEPYEGVISPSISDHLWLGNFFDSYLVRDHEHVWRIRRHRVDSSWVNGTVAAIRLPSGAQV